jgi:hypothetical protein
MTFQKVNNHLVKFCLHFDNFWQIIFYKKNLHNVSSLCYNLHWTFLKNLKITSSKHVLIFQVFHYKESRLFKNPNFQNENVIWTFGNLSPWPHTLFTFCVWISSSHLGQHCTVITTGFTIKFWSRICLHIHLQLFLWLKHGDIYVFDHYNVDVW